MHASMHNIIGIWVQKVAILLCNSGMLQYNIVINYCFRYKKAMASPSTQSSVCKYCKNFYKDPRILSCLHSYCLHCITKIHIKGSTSLTCPLCSFSTPLANRNVSKLPQNGYLEEEARKSKVMQQVTSVPPPVCYSCEDDHSISVAYCKDCEYMLCKDCSTVHKKTKKYNFHTIFSIDELKRKSQIDLLNELFSSNSTSPLCSDHDSQNLSSYCLVCNVPVCDECILSTHNGHSVEDISKHATESRTKIVEGREAVTEKKEKLEEIMETIEKAKRTVKDNKKKVDEIIQEAFAELRHHLDKREKFLLIKNKQISNAKETYLSMQLQDFRCLSEAIDQFYQAASVTTSDNDVHVLFLAHTLQERVTFLQQAFAGLSLDPCETTDISADVNTNTTAEMLKKFGYVYMADPSPSVTNATTVVPHQNLAIGTEMKVRVSSKDSSGNVLCQEGAVVRGTLTCTGKGSINLVATDDGDGTYVFSISPQHLAQHQLFISMNGQRVQNSPFNFGVLAKRDYSKLKNPVQEIHIHRPKYVAFSNEGDMFVTSGDDCIHVYDCNGEEKATIGSNQNFQLPSGIAINGELIYVAEYEGHRIHKLTTGGDILHTFGEQGQDIGQFESPSDLQVSPDNKLYVADSYNNRIQVFHSDCSFSHAIDGNISGDGSFSQPEGIAFDLSGNVHVAGFGSSSVTVLSPTGKFLRQYESKYTDEPQGIAIDPSGYSLVTIYRKGSLRIFDPRGKFTCSIEGFRFPCGVSISPDGSIWVADRQNNKLIKY